MKIPPSRQLPKVEKTIRKLEDQFYGRVQEPVQTNICRVESALADCQIEITKPSKKKHKTMQANSPR